MDIYLAHSQITLQIEFTCSTSLSRDLIFIWHFEWRSMLVLFLYIFWFWRNLLESFHHFTSCLFLFFKALQVKRSVHEACLSNQYHIDHQKKRNHFALLKIGLTYRDWVPSATNTAGDPFMCMQVKIFHSPLCLHRKKQFVGSQKVFSFHESLDWIAEHLSKSKEPFFRYD